jgi:hypothetical protein
VTLFQNNQPKLTKIRTQRGYSSRANRKHITPAFRAALETDGDDPSARLRWSIENGRVRGRSRRVGACNDASAGAEGGGNCT